MEGIPLRGMDVRVGIAEVDDRTPVLLRHQLQTVRLQARNVLDAVEAKLLRQANAFVTTDVLRNHCFDNAVHAGRNDIR